MTFLETKSLQIKSLKHHVEMKAEIKVMLLQGKEYQRLPANHQKQARYERVSLTALRRNQSCQHLHLGPLTSSMLRNRLVPSCTNFLWQNEFSNKLILCMVKAH
ncbi:Hypothetical predicted protein [Marmota monax]|uniref:Uncharacterized protein n=1 Tax=Marmota monax TaxID=9995 RepID=A0A5E4A4Y2_MARMO|nr:hypothetical protein GHT09_004665 [Marmota monax]VTJ52297.1 Hypothetical predicted protein [Marmota monax]